MLCEWLCIETVLFCICLQPTFVWYKRICNTRHAQLNKLCVLNSKILRIIQNKPLSTPVIQLHQSYNNLPIPKLHNFQLLCLVFKYFNCNEKLPIIFSNFFTPNSEIHTHSTRSTNDLHSSSVNCLFSWC